MVLIQDNMGFLDGKCRDGLFYFFQEGFPRNFADEFGEMGFIG